MIKVGARKVRPASRQELVGRDDVYVDKRIVRQDYPMQSSEGKVLCSEVKSAYPDYTKLPFGSSNLVGAYDGYRAPYENSSVSFYNMLTKPPLSLRERYGVSESEVNLQPWYGLKFDLTKDEVMFKCVIKTIDCRKPELPKGIDTFFATTHSIDESMSDWVDYYVSGVEPERIKAFCIAKGLKYPMPEDMSAIDVSNIWAWGFVFDKNTLEYGAVKGYVRVRIEQ